MNKETGSTFLMREFESLLANHGCAGWNDSQIQIVRDWIDYDSYSFKSNYDRLEAADLCGRPFTGPYSYYTAPFAQEVLLKLVTLRDRDNGQLGKAMLFCMTYATHLPTCVHPNGCDCGFREMYSSVYDLANEPTVIRTPA